MNRRWLPGLLVLLAAGGCGSPAPAPSATATPPATPGASVTAEPPTVRPDALAPPGWVDLSSVDPTILVEVRYQGPHNFTGRPVDGYREPVCLLPERTARALHRAQAAASAEGYRLKVYECYRPLRATADFLRWRDTPDETMRAEFFPGLTKAELFSRGFVASRSAHSAGAAVDVTLVKMPVAKQRAFVPGEPIVACTAPAGERFPDNSIDMGTGYDCFDARSHTTDARVTGEARENRLRLRRLMGEGGFTAYANEWWHFELGGRTGYFDFPVARAALR